MKDAILQPSRQLQNMKGLLRRWNGPYTQLLRQTPGHLGLGRVPERLRPEGTTGAVCGFCSTGCGLRIHHRNGVAVNVSPDTLYPVNKGMACPKGWEALTPLYSEDRALVPRLRDSDGHLQTVSWNEALETMVSRFRSIQAAFGPESIAFLSTGQMMTEEMALLGALAKFGMGMRHGDGNTRQCMATAVTAYKESFGFDAPPYTYSDLEESDVLVFVGANPCIAHPILWQRVLGNTNRPEILVVDPRKTETASAATRHYAIQPKSDLVLFYGLANLLIREGWVDREFIREHTAFFETFVDHVSEFSMARITDATGLREDEVRAMASLLRPGKRVLYWWTMGVNQSHEGTRVAQAIINLALMTGQIGKPGSGANSITGQCNAMGSRLFSNITNLLGGHEFESPEHRRKVADELGLDEQRIPREKSWAYDQILDGIDRGDIRGLWIVATNTAHSWIHQGRCRDRLSRLDFLVVQDLHRVSPHQHRFMAAIHVRLRRFSLQELGPRVSSVAEGRAFVGARFHEPLFAGVLIVQSGCSEQFPARSGKARVSHLSDHSNLILPLVLADVCIRIPKDRRTTPPCRYSITLLRKPPHPFL